MIIPHTLSATTLGGLRKGQRVNLEMDMIGKYVRRQLGELPRWRANKKGKRR
jgi:riboflavin synthase